MSTCILSFFSCFSFSHFTIYFCLFYWDQFQTFLIYAFKGLNVTLHEYMLSHFSHVWLCDPLNCSPPCSSVHEHGHSRQECWTGLPCLLPEVFPIQGLNLCLLHLLHWKQILYCWATGEAHICSQVGGSGGKESACQCRRPRFNPWVKKSSWRREWQPTPVFLLGKFQGQRSLAGCSPLGHKE